MVEPVHEWLGDSVAGLCQGPITHACRRRFFLSFFLLEGSACSRACSQISPEAILVAVLGFTLFAAAKLQQCGHSMHCITSCLPSPRPGKLKGPARQSCILMYVLSGWHLVRADHDKAMIKDWFACGRPFVAHSVSLTSSCH